MVGAVREGVAVGATLDEVRQRVLARLAPTYEKPFSGATVVAGWFLVLYFNQWK